MEHYKSDYQYEDIMNEDDNVSVLAALFAIIWLGAEDVLEKVKRIFKRGKRNVEKT